MPLRNALRLGSGLCLLSAVVLAETPAQAAREGGPSTAAVMLNPVGLVYGPLSLEFDFGLGSQASLNLSGARWQSVPGGGGVSAWSVAAGAQLFAVGPIYDGVYVTPSLGMMWISSESSGVETQLSALLPQVVFGYQWDWKVVSLRLGLGGYYLVPRPRAEQSDLGLEGLGLALDFAFGLSF